MWFQQPSENRTHILARLVPEGVNLIATAIHDKHLESNQARKSKIQEINLQIFT